MPTSMVIDILFWCWDMLKKILWYWLAFMFMIPWFVAGILFSISYVGWPYAKICFKSCTMMWKYDWEVIGDNKFCLDYSYEPVVNTIWVFTFGLPLAAMYLATALVMVCSVVFFPFGRALFRIVKYAFAPFGAYVE